MTQFYFYLSFKRRVNFECGDYTSMNICTTFLGNETTLYIMWRGTVSSANLESSG